jgi:hypothetical protein
MAWFARLPRQKAGQPITARAMNRTTEAAEWATKIGASWPLGIISTVGGPFLRYLGQIFGAYVGVTDGTITARSGTTPGTGNVTLYGWNGSALVSIGQDVVVWSISSTTGGIPTGTYCIVLRIYDAYWLISVDCGN